MNSSQRNWSCFNIFRQPFAPSAIPELFIWLSFQIFNCQLTFKLEEEDVQKLNLIQMSNVVNFQVSAKFMIEDDEEQMKEELKEAFRIYDKEVNMNIKSEHKWKYRQNSVFKGSFNEQQSYGLGAWVTPQNHRLRFQKFLQRWVK